MIQLRWLASAFVCLALQSCRTLPDGHTTAGTPFVVSFEFQEPVLASADEKDRFVKALKYAVPEKSKVLVDGKEVWPLLKTERIVKSAAGGGEGYTVQTRGAGARPPPFANETRLVAHTRITQGEGMVANTRGGPASGNNTQHIPMDAAFVARAKSTQYFAFKSEKDMREFLRILGGGKK